MAVGYLPDMFGHIAQMPQLLRWPASSTPWCGGACPRRSTAPGSGGGRPTARTVRAEYLPVGYGNGAAMPDDAKALVRRVAAHEAEVGTFLLGADSPMLWMNGTDHQAPQPWLGRVVAEANAIQDDYRLVVSSLADYLGQAPTDGLPSWTGELRSGARANLLMGVASNRVDVKQAAARAERALERQAEPLCALWLPAERWPDALLAEAWREVIRNSAHDSICACSADEVGAAVLHRYAEAFGIADGLRQRALAAAAGSMAAAGPVVVNPSARPRGGVVELTVAGDAPVEGAQVVSAVPAATVEVAGEGGELGRSARPVDGGWLPGGRRRRLDRLAGRLTAVSRPCSAPAPVGGIEPRMRRRSWPSCGPRPAPTEVEPVSVRVERRRRSGSRSTSPTSPGFGWSPVDAGPAGPAAGDSRRH